MRRLDQLLSSFGYCTRSQAGPWVRAGRVVVSGQVATAANQKARPEEVQVDGEALECPFGILAVLHKPAGWVCSRDPRDGRSVFDLLPARWSRRNPPVTTVGRLDKDTTGVLVVTDRGELVQRWTSPRHKLPKVYEVQLDRALEPGLVPLFASGKLLLEGETKACAPARLEILAERTGRLCLVEGRYHQVKRMFASQGYAVTALHRGRFGSLTADGLSAGQWRHVTVQEVEQAGEDVSCRADAGF